MYSPDYIYKHTHTRLYEWAQKNKNTVRLTACSSSSSSSTHDDALSISSSTKRVWSAWSKAPVSHFKPPVIDKLEPLTLSLYIYAVYRCQSCIGSLVYIYIYSWGFYSLISSRWCGCCCIRPPAEANAIAAAAFNAGGFNVEFISSSLLVMTI